MVSQLAVTQAQVRRIPLVASSPHAAAVALGASANAGKRLDFYIIVYLATYTVERVLLIFYFSSSIAPAYPILTDLGSSGHGVFTIIILRVRL